MNTLSPYVLSFPRGITSQRNFWLLKVSPGCLVRALVVLRAADLLGLSGQQQSETIAAVFTLSDVGRFFVAFLELSQFVLIHSYDSM